MTAEQQDALVGALTTGRIDDGRAVLSSADMALLVYADKLTHSPGAMTAADVERLREAGFGDRAIHDACAIVAYFAFVNRIAEGLGVEVESNPGAGDLRGA